MQDVLNKAMSQFDEVSFCVILKSNIYDIESISLRVHKTNAPTHYILW